MFLQACPASKYLINANTWHHITKKAASLKQLKPEYNTMRRKTYTFTLNHQKLSTTLADKLEVELHGGRVPIMLKK